MNVRKVFIVFISVSLLLQLGLGGYFYYYERTIWSLKRGAERLTLTVTELEKRNAALDAGIRTARADAERSVELLAQLRTSVRRITSDTRVSLETAGRIKDRARRIDALAGLIVKATERLIEANNFMEEVNTGIPGDCNF